MPRFVVSSIRYSTSRASVTGSGRRVGTGVEERGEDHVAARAHATVESEDSHAYVSGGRRKKPPVPVFDGLSIRPKPTGSGTSL